MSLTFLLLFLCSLCQRFCSCLEHDSHASNGGFSPGVHLFPFRTESLSPGAPMVLPSPVGESVAANLILQALLTPLLPARRQGSLQNLNTSVGSVAQLVEQYTFNVRVLGSNPSGATKGPYSLLNMAPFFASKEDKQCI
jgi:hypothetical protein